MPTPKPSDKTKERKSYHWLSEEEKRRLPIVRNEHPEMSNRDFARKFYPESSPQHISRLLNGRMRNSPPREHQNAKISSPAPASSSSSSSTTYSGADESGDIPPVREQAPKSPNKRIRLSSRTSQRQQSSDKETSISSSPRRRGHNITPFVEHARQHQDSQTNGYNMNASPSPSTLAPPPPPPDSPSVCVPSFSLPSERLGYELLLQPPNQVGESTVNQEKSPSPDKDTDNKGIKLAKEMMEYMSQNLDIQSKYDSLQAENSDKTRQISELHDTITELHGTISQLRGENHHLRIERDDYEDKNKKLRAATKEEVLAIFTKTLEANKSLTQMLESSGFLKMIENSEV